MSTRSHPEVPATERSALPGQLRTAPTRALVAGGFWLAVVLPFVHVPLLLAGVATPGRFGAYVGLLALNVACLAIGHGHQRVASRPRTEP